MENQSAKGHAFEPIEAGASATLLDVSGTGIVQRIWLTVSDRSPGMLRSLRLEMCWEGEAKPAVSVPLGDFFSISHGQTMPFRKGARIVATLNGRAASRTNAGAPLCRFISKYMLNKFSLLKHPHIIHPHLLRENRRAVRVARPVAAHGHVENQEKLLLKLAQPSGRDVNHVELHIVQ